MRPHRPGGELGCEANPAWRESMAGEWKKQSDDYSSHSTKGNGKSKAAMTRRTPQKETAKAKRR